MTKKAIIIGATSGIGKDLAEVMLREGYTLGLCGRRINLLEDLKMKQPERVMLQFVDVTRSEQAMTQLDGLIKEMNGVDVIVVSSGTGHINNKLQWQLEKETIDVNVAGFAAMANIAMRYFLAKGNGHLVGISSIAALIGSSAAPAYSASKAFISNYLEGMRMQGRRKGKNVIVTNIQPGYVDTAMAQGDGMFWVAPSRVAAEQIYAAIRKKKTHAYITRRWRLIAWLLKIVPDFVLRRIG